MKKNTEKESAARMAAKNYLQTEKRLKFVTINGVRITVEDGRLKTDWQLEQERREAENKESERQLKIRDDAEMLFARWGRKGVESFQIEDVYFEVRNRKLVIVDPWDVN